MSHPILNIEGLHVSVEGKEIVKGLNLCIRTGEVHAIMGPNGSGKSTLAYALMGHPRYEITKGKITFQGSDMASLEPEERAQMGLFLGFQYPVAVPGVSVGSFLMTALNALSKAEAAHGKSTFYKDLRKNFRKNLKQYISELKIEENFANRYLNDGFSGGEKKRIEILQLLCLQPTLAVLDETDSGLDIDALKTVSNGVNTFMGPDRAVLVITHYQRILNHLKPQFVHILAKGDIIKSGGPELDLQLEEEGYKAFGILEQESQAVEQSPPPL